MSEVLEHVRRLIGGADGAVSVVLRQAASWRSPYPTPLSLLVGSDQPRSGPPSAARRSGSGPVVGIWTEPQRLYEPAARLRRREAGFRSRRRGGDALQLPVQHFLVYGIGKPLLERGLLPKRSPRAQTDSRASKRWQPRPDQLGRSLFRAVDRLNDRPGARTSARLSTCSSRPASPHSASPPTGSCAGRVAGGRAWRGSAPSSTAASVGRCGAASARPARCRTAVRRVSATSDRRTRSLEGWMDAMTSSRRFLCNAESSPDVST